MSPLVSTRAAGRCTRRSEGALRCPCPRGDARAAVCRRGNSSSSRIRSRHDAAVSATDGVADALGRCTRIACAAVLALVLMGDNTSAGSSLGRETAQHHHQCHDHHRRRSEHCSAFAAPSSLCRAPSSSHSSRAVTRGSLQPRMVSLGAILESRRARAPRKNSGGNPTPTAVAGDPSTQNSNNGRELPAAHLFSVRRRGASQGSQRSLLPTPEAIGAGRGNDLNSPRFAAAAGGQSYPERLSVSVNSQVAEGDVFVGSAKGGRPSLPELTEDELTQLRAGQRVQHQQREGGSGTGSVVVDVRADPDVVLEYLTKYEDYDTMIDTVRQCEVFPSDVDNQRKVEVTVSRFRLHIRVLMTLDRDRRMVQFELDPDCTKAGRAVLREATGFFYVESLPDRPGYSRVWMMATVDVNRFVPGGIVDYAAGRALPRASNWIKPTCEAAQRRKLREGIVGSGGAIPAP